MPGSPRRAAVDESSPESGMGLAIIEAIVDELEIPTGRRRQPGTLVRMRSGSPV